MTLYDVVSMYAGFLFRKTNYHFTDRRVDASIPPSTDAYEFKFAAWNGTWNIDPFSVVATGAPKEINGPSLSLPIVKVAASTVRSDWANVEIQLPESWSFAFVSIRDDDGRRYRFIAGGGHASYPLQEVGNAHVRLSRLPFASVEAVDLYLRKVLTIMLQDPSKMQHVRVANCNHKVCCSEMADVCEELTATLGQINQKYETARMACERAMGYTEKLMCQLEQKNEEARRLKTRLNYARENEVSWEAQESKISKFNARLDALACRAEQALPASSAQNAGKSLLQRLNIAVNRLIEQSVRNELDDPRQSMPTDASIVATSNKRVSQLSAELEDTKTALNRVHAAYDRLSNELHDANETIHKLKAEQRTIKVKKSHPPAREDPILSVHSKLTMLLEQYDAVVSSKKHEAKRRNKKEQQPPHALEDLLVVLNERLSRTKRLAEQNDELKTELGKFKKSLAECQSQVTSLAEELEHRRHFSKDLQDQLDQAQQDVSSKTVAIEAMDEKIRCPVCQENEKDTAFVCGHTCCRECARQWGTCIFKCRNALTRQSVAYNFRIYL